MAVDPNNPVPFRIRYASNTKELFIVFDLGFSNSVTNATVRFVSWTFNPACGVRQVVNDYYRMFPAAFRDRIVEHGGRHGTWLIKDLSDNSVENPQDFGFLLNQNILTSNSIAHDEANRIFDTVYVHPTEMFVNVADLGSNPSYSQIIGRLDDLASGAYVESGNTSAQSTAKAIQNSAVKDENGNYIYHTGSAWSPTDARFLVNCAPHIEGENTFEDQWENSAVQNLLDPGSFDGIMCDNAEYSYWASATSKTRFDYSSTHFLMMQTPLSHDRLGKVGIIYESMIWEYLNAVRKDVESRNKFVLMQANGVPYNTTFLAPKLDVIGGEQTWDYQEGWHPPSEEECLHFRAQAGRKVITFLQNSENIDLWSYQMTEKYFSRSCAFGVMPSFFAGGGGNDPNHPRYFENQAYFDRDRPIFQKYIPTIRRLSEAGWEPLRRATLSDGSLFLERFGSEYFTVFNPTDFTKTAVLTYGPAPLNFSGKELIGGSDVYWSNGETIVTLQPDQVAVLYVPAEIHFTFEEGQAPTIGAESPYSNIVASKSSGGVTWVATGIRSNAFFFDGVSGFLTVPHSEQLNASDNGLTYSAWIKPAALASAAHSCILSKGGGQYLSVFDRHLYFKITTSNGTQCYCYGSTMLQENRWYHVAGTYDREGYMRVYVDGRQDGLTQGPFLDIANNIADLRIGDYNTGGKFNGIIDELEMFSRGLNAREIRELKDRASNVYHFPLEDGAGTIAREENDAAKDGTISGASWHINPAFDRKDNALYFDGIDDYVSIPGSQSDFITDGFNGFSLTAWIKTDSSFPGGHSMVISRGNTYLSVYNGKMIFKMLTDANVNQRYCSSPAALSPNTWYHVAAVCEADGTMKIYLNGALNATSGPYPNPSNQSVAAEIGRWSSNGYFKGIIENVRLVRKALSAAEVDLLYQNRE